MRSFVLRVGHSRSLVCGTGVFAVTGTSAALTYEGGPEPFHDEQWDYASTAAMRSAAVFYATGNPPTLETESVSAACPVGKFARTYYPGDGSEGNVDFDWTFPTGRREIWVEFYIRFNDAWSGTSDDKTLFISGSGTARWEIHYGGSGGTGGTFCGANNMTTEWTVDSEPIYDGQWHRTRLYLRMSSSAVAADGAMYWQVDDTTLLSDTVQSSDTRTGENAVTGNAGSDNFGTYRLGANADPNGSGVRDWGRFRVFEDDPGWSWT